MMRSPSAGDSTAPVSLSPSASRSTQSRPSGFSITSTTPASSSQAAMPGPRAVRSMRAPREDVSVLKGVTVITGLAMDHETDQEDRYWPMGNTCESVVGAWRVKAGEVQRAFTELSSESGVLRSVLALVRFCDCLLLPAVIPLHL